MRPGRMDRKSFQHKRSRAGRSRTYNGPSVSPWTNCRTCGSVEAFASSVVPSKSTASGAVASTRPASPIRLPGFVVRAARVSKAVTPAPPRATVGWTVEFDYVLGHSVPMTVLVAVLTLLAAGAGLWLFRMQREIPPGTPVLYVPPQGLGPAQTRYIADETEGDDPEAELRYPSDHAPFKPKTDVA